jgi:hypothetical protein
MSQVAKNTVSPPIARTSRTARNFVMLLMDTLELARGSPNLRTTLILDYVDSTAVYSPPIRNSIKAIDFRPEK